MTMIRGLLFFTLLHLDNVFSFGPSSDGDPSQSSEVDAYPCFRDITCNLGIEAKEKIYACYDFTSKEDNDMGIEWMRESSEHGITSTGNDEAFEEFCALEEKPRYILERAVHHYLGGKLMDGLGIICSSDDEERCEQWRTLTTCVADLLDEYSDKKQCGNVIDAQKKFHFVPYSSKIPIVSSANAHKSKNSRDICKCP